MTDEFHGDDPFSSEDPQAAERERRRREREERRRQKSQASQKSLGERVSGALDHGPTPARRQAEPPQPRPEPAAPREQPAERSPGQSGPAAGSTMRRRRLIAGGAILAVVALVLLLVSAAGDDGGDPQPAAAEPAVAPTTSVTIPEGLTQRQIADLAKEANLKGSYMKASSKAPKGFNLKEYGAEGAPSLEGFLFPATYELEKRAPSSDLVAKQLEALEDNLAEVDLRQAKKKNLTPYDVLIIASMIEREVSVPEERRLVAAVIYNRLSAGEPLGVDATLRYELDNFTEPLKESELATDTPYNTRLNAGLPPTPIGNPGLASIQAAAKPANKDFRFYVIKPGTCNEHFFTADSAEFDAAVAEYQAALEAEGGSPTECPE